MSSKHAGGSVQYRNQQLIHSEVSSYNGRTLNNKKNHYKHLHPINKLQFQLVERFSMYILLIDLLRSIGKTNFIVNLRRNNLKVPTIFTHILQAKMQQKQTTLSK